MKTYDERLELIVAEEMLSIIGECEDVDLELIEEFMNDTTFLNHVWNHAFNSIDWENTEEGEDLQQLVESIPEYIANVFDGILNA